VVVWGEYNAVEGHGLPIRIFASYDRGHHFEVVHTFLPRSVLHVHSLLYDAGLEGYWVFCGDFGDEPGIGLLSRDFRNFEWVCKGEQRFRACDAFDFGDRLVYATDTPLAANEVVSLDKRTGRVEHLQPIVGSCLHAARFDDFCVFSTTAEPGARDKHRKPSLWASTDGANFREIFVAEKDYWPYAFQFGSLVLPRGHSSKPNVFFSGQAVSQFDGRLLHFRLDSDAFGEQE
jgi:hypothetical protein